MALLAVPQAASVEPVKRTVSAGVYSPPRRANSSLQKDWMLLTKPTMRQSLSTFMTPKLLASSRGTSTTDTALMTRGFSQLYLSLGDPNPDGSLAVRLYYKPLVLLIWLGAVVMVVGGALSLSDRRLRVGAPKPARSRTALAPAE